LLGDIRGIFIKTLKAVMIPYTTQITCRQVFYFVTGNVSMILTLSTLPGIKEKLIIITLRATIATHFLAKMAKKIDENRF
jgi:hypothetical protein